MDFLNENRDLIALKSEKGKGNTKEFLKEKIKVAFEPRYGHYLTDFEVEEIIINLQAFSEVVYAGFELNELNKGGAENES